MIEDYLSPNDLFGVIPEAPRLLMVIIPIEQSIAKHFVDIEVAKKDWDYPFYKHELEKLMDSYNKWFKKTGKNRLAKS